MDNIVIDIGCSNLKGHLVRGTEVVESYRVPTPVGDIQKIVEESQGMINRYHERGYYVTGVIVVSLSDALVYEHKDGEIGCYWWDAELPIYNGTPDYMVSGKPPQKELGGMAQQLKHIKTTHGLDTIHRILPISTYVATVLAGDRTWHAWDWTHASNSGMYDMREKCWHESMHPFIDAGCIHHQIYAPSQLIQHAYGVVSVFLGGHDTTFIYNTWDMPYIILGTWITVGQVAADFAPDKMSDLPVRWLMDANGRIHSQMCLHSGDSDKYDKIIEFLHRQDFYGKPTKIVGTWADDFCDGLLAAEDIHNRPRGGLKLEVDASSCSPAPVARYVSEKRNLKL